MAGPKDDLPDVPYAQLVCALLFIARCTRPDILFSVTFLCRYLTNYTTAHFKAAIRVLTYLKCTMDFKLSYRVASSDVQPVEIYIDSDWGGDKETGRSTAGGVVFLYGNPVSWFCQKQDCVSLSTSEAEYKTQTYAFTYVVIHFRLSICSPFTPGLGPLHPRQHDDACTHVSYFTMTHIHTCRFHGTLVLTHTLR